MSRGHIISFQPGQDRLGKLLTQFHAPLIKGVDLPNDPLDEDLVFIKGDQGA